MNSREIIYLMLGIFILLTMTLSMVSYGPIDSEPSNLTIDAYQINFSK